MNWCISMRLFEMMGERTDQIVYEGLKVYNVEDRRYIVL